MITRLSAIAAVSVFVVVACSSPQQKADEARDLTLAPVDETAAVFNDQPQEEPARVGLSDRETVAQSDPVAVLPAEPETDPLAEPELEAGARPTEPATFAEPPAPPTLAKGRRLNLNLLETINTADKGVGDPVSATIRAPVFSNDGDLVIPAGAVFRGTIAEVDASDGRVELEFTTVAFNDAEHEIEGVTATVREESETDDQADDRTRIGVGAGTPIVDTRGQGIGRSPDGPVIVITAGTGISCDAPPGFFPFGTSSFRRVWSR